MQPDKQATEESKLAAAKRKEDYWDKPGHAVLRQDSHLLGWVDHLQSRQEHLEAALRLIEEEGGFEQFTRLEHRGFSQLESGDIAFKEFAPNAVAMSLVGDFNAFDTSATPMHRLEGKGVIHGVWEVNLPAGTIKEGTEVAVVISPNPTEIVPYPRELTRIPAQILHATQSPGETSYRGRMAPIPSVFPRSGYDRHDGRAEKRPRRPSKPASERIYEAHIGVAIGDDSGIGTYAHFEQQILPRVKAGGYTTLQLMGIAEHPYYPSFGYQVSSFFAPSSRFGSMSDLIRLIDAAHATGIRVVLDVVHGHASSNEGEGLNHFDGTETSGYFKHQWHPEWKTRLFDYSQLEVIRFLLCNLRYWVERVGFDGFRFDSVTSSLFLDHGLNRGFSGNYDEYFGDIVDRWAVTYFQLANHFLSEMFPGQITTIAEDVSGYPTLCRPVSEGGLGFDYRLALGHPDMWFKLLAILSSLMGRRAHLAEKTIAYVECHDQCIGGHKTAAHWLFDTDIYDQMAKGAAETDRVRVGMRWHKLMRMLTHTLGGEGYLNFMGNEFGHPEWLDFPALHNHYSHAHAHRKWHLADDAGLRFNDLLAFDVSLNARETTEHWLQSAPAVILLHDEVRRLIVFTRADLLFAFNLHATDASEAVIPTAWPGKYENILDSDECWYGGQSQTSRFGIEAGANPITDSKCSTTTYPIQLYIPPLTGVILKPSQEVIESCGAGES